jgi:DNA invertase Pin-like site-specific DNA recombinase
MTPSDIKRFHSKVKHKDRDEAGRTSKREHRYNFKRNTELLSKIKEKRLEGKTIKEICEDLQIAKTTFYRCCGEDAAISEIIKKTKNVFYQAAHRKKIVTA